MRPFDIEPEADHKQELSGEPQFQPYGKFIGKGDPRETCYLAIEFDAEECRNGMCQCFRDKNDMKVSRGIRNAVLFSLPLWALLYWWLS